MVEIAEYLERERGIRLSPQQRRAAEALDGKILLLAVPGAGKTTVLAARTAGLLANRRIPAGEILTITFSRESARDMEERWNRLFGGLGLSKPSFSTIHSFCYSLLREYASLRGSQVPRLLEGEGEGARNRILTELYRRQTGQYLSEERLGDLQNAMGYCVNMRLSPQESARMDRRIEGFSAVFAAYTAYKRENHLMDFDDMLLFACTALERSAALRERISRKYSHIQVDEAQDTSRIQHQILGMICRENLFMVGDEDQSIYGFRGAWPQGLTEFFARWPEGVLLKLERNYRSTGNIVESALRLIRNNRSRYDKAMETPRGPGCEVLLHTGLDMEKEYEQVVRSLERLKPGESCAVLYRTTHSGLLLSALLRKKGIPFFSREARLGWAGDMTVRDVAGLIRFACDLSDKKLFSQLYFKLGCPIPRAIAERALAQGEGDLLKWLIEEEDWYAKNTGKLSYARRILLGMRGKSSLAQVDAIIHKLDYLHTLDKKGAGGYPFNSYAQKLTVIRKLAAWYEEPSEFLERLYRAEENLAGTGPAAITLSTVHSAKGQEFDRVVIVDALDGIFPSSEAIESTALDDDQLMEEETRLFYTAMTRARDTLEIYAPSSGLGRMLDPSRFLGPVMGRESAGIVPGRQLTHSYFGVGQILETNPVRRTFTVAFRTAGIKTFAWESLEDPRLFRML